MIGNLILVWKKNEVDLSYYYVFKKKCILFKAVTAMGHQE